MIENGLYALLSGDPDVSAIVSDRIYPLMIPQHVQGDEARQPSIVYTKDGVERQVMLSHTDNVVRASFQIDSYALTHAAVLSLAAAIRSAMLDYAGTVGGVVIKAAMLENEFSGVDAEPGLFRVTQFWTVWHEE